MDDAGIDARHLCFAVNRPLMEAETEARLDTSTPAGVPPRCGLLDIAVPHAAADGPNAW